jgi:acetyl-CoA acetyltransferase
VRQVDVIGAGITPFGKRADATVRTLGAEAIGMALADAGVAPAEVGLLVHGNAMAGLLDGQEMIRGQVVAAGAGLSGIPVVNVENACATSSSALHVALAGIRAGMYDTAVVCGTEKMSGRPTGEILAAMTGGADRGRLGEITRDLTGSDEPLGSFFMAVYARIATEYQARTGATAGDFADVAVKNSAHGALNPNAQYQRPLSRDEILASRVVAGPLTMMMCSPIADGAAALVLRAADVSGPRTDGVRIRGCALRSGVTGSPGAPLEQRTAAAAYEEAGLGPEDLDVAEVHDAAAPAELIMYEELGLCALGEGPKLLASGATALGGRVPVNPDGGLVSRGHPVGATGCAQLVELVTQLRGRAGTRQVPGARVGLAENAGGYLHPEAAACVVTILSRG